METPRTNPPTLDYRSPPAPKWLRGATVPARHAAGLGVFLFLLLSVFEGRDYAPERSNCWLGLSVFCLLVAIGWIGRHRADDPAPYPTKGQLFKQFFALFSLVICVASLIQIPRTSIQRITRDDCVYVGRYANAGFSQFMGSPRLVAFSHVWLGPYTGSHWEANLGKKRILKLALGDFLGIYLRVFVWNDHEPLWTLAISLWDVAIASAIAPTVWVYRRRRNQRT